METTILPHRYVLLATLLVLLICSISTSVDAQQQKQLTESDPNKAVNTTAYPLPPSNSRKKVLQPIEVKTVIAKAEIGVNLTIVKQMVVEGTKHNPLAKKGIVFRITNNTKATVYIRGFKQLNGFYAHNNLLVYEEERGWVTRAGKITLPTFDDYKESGQDYYPLLSGKNFEFVAKETHAFAGKTIKFYVFISRNNPGEPELVESPEFILDPEPIQL